MARCRRGVDQATPTSGPDRAVRAGHSDGRHADLYANARQSTAVPGTADRMNAAKTANRGDDEILGAWKRLSCNEERHREAHTGQCPSTRELAPGVSPGPFPQMQANGQSRGQSESERFTGATFRSMRSAGDSRQPSCEQRVIQSTPGAIAMAPRGPSCAPRLKALFRLQGGASA